MPPPRFDQDLGFGKAVEDFAIKQLITRAAVERFTIAMVLNVLSDTRRAERMIDFVANRYPAGNAFMLFQAWEDFGPVFRPPEPSPAFLNGGWVRGGLASFRIDQP